MDSITVYVRFAEVDAEWARLNPEGTKEHRGVSIAGMAYQNVSDPLKWKVKSFRRIEAEQRYEFVLEPRPPTDEDIIAELG